MLKDFTFEMFVDFCILRGCDYLESLPKIGLKTALQYISKHKSIEEVVRWMEKVKEWFTPKLLEEYLAKAKNVRLMFKYQTVFNPKTKKLTQLSKIPEGLELDMKVVGKHMSDEELEVYSEGLLNPYSEKK